MSAQEDDREPGDHEDADADVVRRELGALEPTESGGEGHEG